MTLNKTLKDTSYTFYKGHNEKRVLQWVRRKAIWNAADLFGLDLADKFL